MVFSQIPLRFPLFIFGFRVVARLLFSGVFLGFRSSLHIDPRVGIDGVLSDLCPGSDCFLYRQVDFFGVLSHVAIHFSSGMKASFLLFFHVMDQVVLFI
jgi:hypothetical protein